jgi:CRISPR-associated protein Csd1
MSWLQKLFETYETCYGREPAGSIRLLPIAHTTQLAQVEIVLDARGRFRRASVLDKERGVTLIPCTEGSSGRSGKKPVSHPLCDKLQYVAGDFSYFGGEVTSGFASDPEEPYRDYLAQLADWAASKHGHSKLDAILKYVRRGRVIEDLVRAEILPVDAEGSLAKLSASRDDQAPAICKVHVPGQLPEDAFVRWRVEDSNDASGTGDDSTLWQAWIDYYASTPGEQGHCMVTGKITKLAKQHPGKLRHAADRAKLISSNDTAGFTFRGRFTDAAQAVGVGYEVTQKAHNALRWLIERQGSRVGTQTIVSWNTRGIEIPDPMLNTFEGLAVSVVPQGDTSAGEIFAKQLRLAINGYRVRLDASNGVQVIALNAATLGRMSISFYRELSGSEFLQRIEAWHSAFAWPQNYGKDRRFIGAPAPRDIAQTACGGRIDEKLEMATRERLLPCIVDGAPFPDDLVQAVCRRAINRAPLKSWEWEKCLGIACALFKGKHLERSYQMTLEADRTSRDYLFGRMLAIAENIEGFALREANEGRATGAARLMQQFANRPSSTWRTLELSLPPYKSRLRNRAPGFLVNRERMLDKILASFNPGQFESDAPLTAEFLLGYRCQRDAFYASRTEAAPEVVVADEAQATTDIA